jgi:hypothetical protein
MSANGHCKHCNGDMIGDGFTMPMQCEDFREHPDLCPEADSGPWYCNTDGFTTFEECEECEIHKHPDTLIVRTITKPDGSSKTGRICDDCQDYFTKKGTACPDTQ